MEYVELQIGHKVKTRWEAKPATGIRSISCVDGKWGYELEHSVPLIGEEDITQLHFNGRWHAIVVKDGIAKLGDVIGEA
jgi:hypothetical protein